MLRTKFFGNMKGSPPVPVDGVYGLFKSGGAQMSRYNYSANTSVGGPTLTSTNDRVTSVGNGVIGYMPQGTAATAADILSYSAGTVSNTGPALGVAVGSGSCSTSNASIGSIFGNAAAAIAIRVFTFADSTISVGSSLSSNTNGGASGGNADRAVIAIGGAAAGGSTATNYYDYASGSVTPGTKIMATSVKNGAATSNATAITFAVGGAAASVSANKYVYAQDTLAVTTSFTTAMLIMQATGNGTVGIFNNRGVSATQVVTYASDVKVAGSSLASISVASSSVAISSGNLGIF